MNEQIISIKKIDYKKLFKNLEGLYLILDTEFTVIDASADLVSSAKLTRKEMIGKNLFEVFPDNPNDIFADGQSKLRYSLNYVLANKIKHSMAVQRYDVKNQNGEFEKRYWSPINKPILNQNGEVDYIIHRVEDVTDFIEIIEGTEKTSSPNSNLESKIKLMEIEVLKRSKEIQLTSLLDQIVSQRTNHLEEVNKIISKNLTTLTNQKKQLEDFCNIISHDLRAPLINISILTEMLTDSPKNDDNDFLLDKLNKAAKNLTETFDELVESIQISLDTEIKAELIDLKSCAMNIIEALNGEIKKLEAIIEMDFDTAATVFYPANYMKSILHNLISNSLKYCSPERKPFIKIASKKEGDKLTISVSDNGLGIDIKKNKDNLFKNRKVFHDHPSSKGFGLFITKSQIVAFGGNIWIESTPDVGSTFFVELINQ
jgi:signal transduction histidine kinase